MKKLNKKKSIFRWLSGVIIALLLYLQGVFVVIDSKVMFVIGLVNIIFCVALIELIKRSKEKKLFKIKQEIGLILYGNGITKEETEHLDNIIEIIKENW